MFAWYALQVQALREKWISSLLKEKGYEVSWLFYHSLRQWSDRKKEIELAAFPGYVFCRFELRERSSVLSIPGVVRIVGHGRVPVPISEEEIAGLRIIEKSMVPVEPCPYLSPGQRVRIEGGPLDGLTGVLLETRKASRVVVSVTLLQRSVSAEIDAAKVKPLGPLTQKGSASLTELGGGRTSGVKQPVTEIRSQTRHAADERRLTLQLNR